MMHVFDREHCAESLGYLKFSIDENAIMEQACPVVNLSWPSSECSKNQSPSNGLVTHPLNDVYLTSVNNVSSNSLLLQKHLKALEQIKALTIQTNVLTQKLRSNQCKQVRETTPRPGLTWLHDSRNKLLSKNQQVTDAKNILETENKRLKEKLKTKNTVIVALRDEVDTLHRKEEECNVKLKVMENHVKDITAKELSNREAVLLLQEHMKHNDNTTILEKEASELKLKYFTEENKKLKEQIAALKCNLAKDCEENINLVNNESAQLKEISNKLQIQIDDIENLLKIETNKNKMLIKKNYKINEKYKTAVCKLRMYERRYEKLYMKSFIDNNNSVISKENSSIHLNETDGENGATKRPEQDDNSFKLRFLNDEKVRLTAALGKSKHREILLMAKGRKNMYHGTSRHHGHRKLVRK
eukprot:g1991.t1